MLFRGAGGSAEAPRFSADDHEIEAPTCVDISIDGPTIAAHRPTAEGAEVDRSISFFALLPSFRYVSIGHSEATPLRNADFDPQLPDDVLASLGSIVLLV